LAKKGSVVGKCSEQQWGEQVKAMKKGPDHAGASGEHSEGLGFTPRSNGSYYKPLFSASFLIPCGMYLIWECLVLSPSGHPVSRLSYLSPLNVGS
jgi:hypothetical protein